jgi:hypothetical protein
MMFCFYHEQHPPMFAECYSAEKYSTGDIVLPAFEDAHSIQFVLRKTVQLLLQKRIERSTASVLLYALQIASSNLKRMDLEKPQPEQVVVDTVMEEKWEPPIAPMQATPEKEKEKAQNDKALPDNARKEDKEELPPGIIQACYRREYDDAETGTARRQEGSKRGKAPYGRKPKPTLSSEERHDRSRALPKPRSIN